MAIQLAPLTSESSRRPPGGDASPGAMDKNMFLQLLVAQIRNQDPMKPTDGVQFVASWRNSSSLEQTMNTGQDIAAIRARSRPARPPAIRKS